MKYYSLIKILIVLVITVLAISCSVEEEEEVKLEAKCDVYIMKKRVNQVISFAPVYILYANKSVQSVEVKTPENNFIDLESLPDQLYTFAQIPTDSYFLMEIPPDGEYLFTVKEKDETETSLSDQMDFQNIDLPNIRSAGYSEDLLAMKVTWDSINNVDAFIVKMLDDGGSIYFNGPILNSTTREYVFGEFDNGWYINPYFGFSYTIQVQAISFEDAATDQNYYYNIEEMSISETTARWGN